ncbi:MAG TPA: hypothetical protein VFG05_07655 [Methylocella sp.]|nr:hypothetical protein [Methylocella sp.]
MDTDELRKQLEDLEAARAMGVRRVLFMSGGQSRTIEYRDDSEMLRAIGELRRKIAELEGTAAPRSLRVICDKGY